MIVACATYIYIIFGRGMFTKLFLGVFCDVNCVCVLLGWMCMHGVGMDV